MNRLTGIARFEQSVRNSRFIGVCGPVDDPEQARAFVEQHGEPGCRHVCYAWRIGDQVKFDDAGEPGGTAGRPVLTALDHFEIDRAIVVVSRFFGGIKLGTGGLARAYGGTAMETLALAPMAPIIETVTLVCAVPFDSAGELHQIADRHDAEKLDDDWTASGLSLTLRLPGSKAREFRSDLTANTRGAASVEEVKKAAD